MLTTQNTQNSVPGAFSEISLRLQFLTYVPSYQISIDTEQYLLKTASSLDELREVFKLRYDVFLRDTDQEETAIYDFEKYDTFADHIIIIHKDSGKVCGTYRIICSHLSDNFYSEDEFILSKFKETKGVKLELGRACISKEHRKGGVLDLLWKGIANYAILTKATYLFGCSSIKTTSFTNAKNIYHYFLSKSLVDKSFEVVPTIEHSFLSDFETENNVDLNKGKELVPSLLKSYCSAGAKVASIPALDMHFKCIDFLTILNLGNINNSFKSRYF